MISSTAMKSTLTPCFAIAPFGTGVAPTAYPGEGCRPVHDSQSEEAHDHERTRLARCVGIVRDPRDDELARIGAAATTTTTQTQHRLHHGRRCRLVQRRPL